MPLVLQSLDRTIRRPLVGGLAALAAAFVGSALPRGAPVPLRLLVAAMLASAVVVARWTWIRLWRSATSPAEHIIYDHGVRTIGPLLYVILVAGLGYQQSVWSRLQQRTPNAWMQLLILLVVSVPLALGIGFGWGWVRSRFTASE